MSAICIMNKPSEIAVGCVRELFPTTPMSDKPRWCEIVQSAIDKATAGMVSIEDVWPLLNALGSGTSSYQYSIKDRFLAKHGEKLK